MDGLDVSGLGKGHLGGLNSWQVTMGVDDWSGSGNVWGKGRLG